MIISDRIRQAGEDLYRHYTRSKAIESNSVPYFSDDPIHVHVPKLMRYDVDTSIDVENINGSFPYLCYRVDDIFYNTLRNIDRNKVLSFDVDALTLINEGIIKPFLLFFRNRFVKLSQIKIYNDGRYTHIIFPYDFENTDEFISTDYDINILHFPREILYNEDNKFYDTDIIECAMSFNDNGRLDPSGTTRVYIDVKEDYIFRWGSSTYGQILNEETSIDDSKHLRPTNIICFKDGMLFRDAKVEVDPYNCITIENGRYIGIDKLDYKIFYDPVAIEERNNLDTPQVFNHVLLRELHHGLNSIDDIDCNLIELPYDYELDPTLTYDENITKFIEYSNECNENFILDRLTSNNIHTYYRRVKDLPPNYINKYTYPSNLGSNCGLMMFVNGMMSTDRILSKVPSGAFYRMADLNDDDIVEFISIRLEGEESYFSYHRDTTEYYVDIGTEEFSLYIEGVDHPDKAFEMQDESRIYYTINEDEWSYNVETKILTMIATDKYDDGIVIYVKPRRSYSYYHDVIEEESYRIILDSTFNRCNNENNYMFFINGKRINSSMYRVVVPETDKPFNTYAIYSHLILRVGDSVEVVYCPLSIVDEVYIEDLDHSMEDGTGIDRLGFINGPLDYPVPLHKNLQFFFVDGRKIPLEYIYNIDNNTVRVIDDIKTVQELSILSPDEDLTAEITDLDLVESNYDKFFNKMGKDSINIMTNTYTYISEEGLETMADITKTELIHAIVRDFYALVNKGVPMVYTYDAETFTETDSAGNIILDVVDGNVLNNVAHTQDE